MSYKKALKDWASKLRDNVVASMSHVVEQDAGVRKIKSGNDLYGVEKSSVQGETRRFACGNPKSITPTEASVNAVLYKVTDAQDNSKTLILEKRELTEHGKKYGEVKVDKCVVGFADNMRGDRIASHTEVCLEPDTDITNINSVLYQLKHKRGENAEISNEFAHFIDKFVVVTPEERKSYRDFEDKMNKKAYQDMMLFRNKNGKPWE